MFPCFRRAALLFHFLLLRPTLSAAYSWVLNAPATQCSNLSVSIMGSDGVPPYRILVVPSGPSPFSTEVRSVIDHPFDGNSTTASFAINYPVNSQFVAVVSDARGFGTGGASVATQISDSGDSSCISLSNPTSTLFFYYVGSDNQFTQCESSRIWWNASTVRGTPNFVGIIPGGQSFTIPEPLITTQSPEGTGFSWTASITVETRFMIVAGDNRGMGSGGYAAFKVNPSSDESCLNNLSPSSTPGAPAGTYSTSTVTAVSSTNSAAPQSRGTNTAALIGGVVGGVAGGLLLLIGILVYLLWGRSSRRLIQGPQIDLLDDPPTTEGVSSTATQPRSGHGDILSYYLAESYGQTTSENPSGSTYSSIPRLNTRPSALTSITSGSSSDGYYRPAVVHHKDAGLTLLPPAEERIVELPPRYDNIGVRNHPSSELLGARREMGYLS